MHAVVPVDRIGESADHFSAAVREVFVWIDCRLHEPQSFKLDWHGYDRHLLLSALCAFHCRFGPFGEQRVAESVPDVSAELDPIRSEG